MPNAGGEVIDRDGAIAIASLRAEHNGWGFSEPLEVVHRRGWFGQYNRFEIRTNVGNRGTKAHFLIDAKTGEILSEGYIPR